MQELKHITHFTTGGIEELTKGDDNFRWVRKVFGVPDGLNYLADKKVEDGKEILKYEYFNDLILTVIREKNTDGILEKYTLSNPSQKAQESDDVQVAISFADDLDIAEVSLSRRAYMRYYLGENCFCVYNSRVNGRADGVGLVLTEGNISQIQPKKIPQKSTTVLNCFFDKKTLQPSEELSFSWLLFSYEDTSEFLNVVKKYMPFPRIEEDKIRVDEGEELFVNGENVQEKILDNSAIVKIIRGEQKLEFAYTSNTNNWKEYFVPTLKEKKKYFDLLASSDLSKEELKYYFKKQNKKIFDILPINLFDDELRDLFLKKAEYALLDIKGYFSPYQILAKYDYLKKALAINEDIRYSEKLNELEPLVKAIFRLKYAANENH